MALNCGRIGFVLIVIITLAVSDQDLHLQKFVKIDVSKINQKENNETTTATPENHTVEGAVTSTSTAQTTLAVTKGEENATTPSTTPATTTTSQPATTTEVAPFELPKEGRLTKKVPSGYYCKCDLKINICDVNCCCDIDCSEEILKTFVCDEEQLDIGEYHHQEGLQSCEVQGGLFCLVGERRDATHDTFYDTNLKKIASKRRWNDIFPLDLNPKDKIASFYRVNDVLKFYNETSEKVEPFTLPRSLTNSDCQIVQPVRFLQDQSIECLRSSLDELEAFTSALVEQQSHLKYLRLPKGEIMEHCMDQDCFNSSIQFCNLAGGNYRETNTSESNDDEVIEEDPRYCPRVSFEFQHNYTHLEGLSIKLFCGQMEPGDEIWTKLDVKFARKNEDKFARKVSGNLGYLKGKPLIVSSVQIPENDTTEDRRTKKYMLSYFTNGTRLPDDSFRMKLPKSKRNRCVIEDHNTILFGENSWNKCNFSPQINVTDGSNFTEICKTLQTGIDDILLHGARPKLQEKTFDEVNWFASMYGNPVNRSADWIQFRTVNVFNEEVSGTGSPSKSYFTCHNVVINVRYQFFHALATVRNVPRQQVLREAEIVFGPRVNLQFALEEDIRVPVFVQVQFFDLTSAGINSGGSEAKGISVWRLLSLMLGFILVISVEM